MNGTRLTSENEHTYTVLGRGPDPSLFRQSGDPSLVVIARGRKYQRGEDIRSVVEHGYFDTLILMPRDSSLALDKTIAQHANLRVLLFDPVFFAGDSSPGELINLAIKEAAGTQVIISWTGAGLQKAGEIHMPGGEDVLCYLPRIQTGKDGVIPSLYVPVLSNNQARNISIDVLPVSPDSRETESLYPYDYCGMYSVERFSRTGGYDPDLKNPYWQKMEFGCRARLWGERIKFNPGFHMVYPEKPRVEESTPDKDYLRFYLRVLAVVYTGDRAQLPFSRIFDLMKSASIGIISAWERLRKEQKWVRRHQYHYRRDARQMVELWGDEN